VQIQWCTLHRTEREIRVEVVGNFLWGAESYGNWLVSA
jgi:hypothetical protein